MNKPCPWCGNTSLITELDENQGTKWGYALCPCGIRGPEVRTHYNPAEDAPWRARALEEWNNRHPAIAPAGVDDAMVERAGEAYAAAEGFAMRSWGDCIDYRMRAALTAALAAQQDGAPAKRVIVDYNYNGDPIYGEADQPAADDAFVYDATTTINDLRQQLAAAKMAASHALVCPACKNTSLMFECVACSHTNYPPPVEAIEATYEYVVDHVVYLRNIEDNPFPEEWDGKRVLLQLHPDSDIETPHVPDPVQDPSPEC